MCSCETDGGYAEFCCYEWRKARKPQHCNDCRSQVQPGSLYQHMTQKWEGDMGTFNFCLHCVGLRAGHHALDEDCNPSIGEIRACARDALREASFTNDTPLEGVNKFRAAYKACVRDVRKNYEAKLERLKEWRATQRRAA